VYHHGEDSDDDADDDIPSPANGRSQEEKPMETIRGRKGLTMGGGVMVVMGHPHDTFEFRIGRLLHLLRP
jgi:hypothetical protein